MDTEDVQALRAQNEALKRELDSVRSIRRERWRRAVSGVLTVLAALATALALTTVWSVRTLTDTDLFVDRVAPILEDQEVADAIGTAAAAELVSAIDLEQRLTDQLPAELGVLAAPITSAAQGLLADGVSTLAQTPAVQSAWEASLAAGHRLTIRILSGSDAAAVQNVDGTVVLDLTPIINEILAQGESFVSGVLDRDVTAPEVTGDDVDAIVAALEEQLGEDLPADFGQVVLFQADNLAAAQQAYQVVRALGWLAPLTALVIVVLALAVSTQRLRTAMWIAIGVTVVMLLLALGLQPLKSSILDAAADQGLDGAIAAGFETVFSSLRVGLIVVVVVGALAGLGLVAITSTRAGEATRDALRRSSGMAAVHPAPFLIGGAVVAIIVAALLPGRSWGQLLFVALLFAVYAAAVLLRPRLASR